MSKQTSITWDVEYRVDRYKVGQRVEIVPVIETINGKPVSDFPPEIVRDVTETLWNDDPEFNDEIDRRKIA
jgi:hypothetical protein